MSLASVRAFFAQHAVQVEVVPVSGAAEIAPHLGIADIVVDLCLSVETPLGAQAALHAEVLTVEQAIIELSDAASQFPEVDLFRRSIQSSARGITR